MKAVVIDYGSGNLRSAAKAFERAAADTGIETAIRVTDDPRTLEAASHIVLPGVGAFADCMAGLNAVPGMREALDREVVDAGKPFLGICIGMQLMAERGLEHGVHEGLGWIAGEVVPILPNGSALRIPHMGWNDLRLARPDHPMFRDIETGADAYFVHSYHLTCAEAGDALAWVEYGQPLVSVVGRANMVGTQFHPEKSQATGLKLIANFLDWRP